MASLTIDELLKHQKFSVLNEEQVASFMTNGFLKLPAAIPLDKCDWWSRNVWNRLGMDRNDKSTWVKETNHMAKQNMIAAREIAPVAWRAICEILGGEDRVHKGGEMWSDAFIVNLGSPEHEGERLPPKELTGWHVDGDFFNHFLDSPEQALLVIPCWSDVEEDAGATWICTEGMKRIGQMLYDHPEGLNPMMNHVDEPVPTDSSRITARFCREAQAAADENFYQMTGKKGDVILMHPLMLHSVSRNALRKERVITNPPVSLSEPFCFNREDPAEYSLVELKTMKELGGPDKFKDWKITGERKIFVPTKFNVRSITREMEDENLRKRGLEKEIGTAIQTPYILQHILKAQEQQQAA